MAITWLVPVPVVALLLAPVPGACAHGQAAVTIAGIWAFGGPAERPDTMQASRTSMAIGNGAFSAKQTT